MTHLEIMLETKEEKNLVKEIDKLPYISFPYTNENLEAIIKGMQINSEDYVLGIMGSGQQGLAMIEKGANDWNNAMTGLPAILQRNFTYYIADGQYPSYSFNDAVLVFIKLIMQI